MTEPISLDDAARAMREAVRDTVKRHSIWYLIQAGLIVVAGAIALIYPLYSSAALVLLLGWILIFNGLFQGISLIGAQNVPHFWFQLVSAVLAVVVGFIFIRNPGIGVGVLTLLLVVFFMMEGISKIIFSLMIRPFPNWGWVLASGILGLVLGAYLLANPVTRVWLLGVLIGIQLISQGVSLGYLAWNARRA